MKLTPWFDGTVKPVRKGIYQQMDGHGKLLGYQYWNGKIWGLWSETPEGAMWSFGVSCSQDDPWRGVAK